MKRKDRFASSAAFGLAVCLTIGAMSFQTGCGATKEEEEVIDCDYTVSFDGIETGEIRAGVSVHDPSIEEVDGKFYIFGSHMTAASSDNLRTWTYEGNGYKVGNEVYQDLKLSKETDEFNWAGNKHSVNVTDDGKYHVWAPDIIYNKSNGLYYMYYCTSSNWYTSNLCYATSENIDGPYTWQKALIYSGFDKRTIEKTDVLDYVDKDHAKKNYYSVTGEYNYTFFPNAIDPTVFYDKDDRMWMVYGSWSGGIFLLELDPETGDVIHPEYDAENEVDPYFGKRLMGGGHESIEAPFIVYDAESDYYYLYVSYGGLTREGGYQIRVFRSKTVDGDYVDMNGEKPGNSVEHANYGLKLSGNYYLPSLKMAYMATGHNSAIIAEDGKRYLCYHTRFDNLTEEHEPRVKQYFLNEEGWPCVMPYATDGEVISESGYETEEIYGRYYVIDQGKSIGKKIAEPVIYYLGKNGNVYADGNEIVGTYEETEGKYYMHMTLNGKEFSGVFCKQKDEAGTEVMTFTAVGENRSIWGVKYF